MATVSARHSSARALAIRYSHSAFAALLLVFMFIGFRHFYLAGDAAVNGGGPIAKGLLIYAVPHGLSNTAWMLTLFLQPLLIANRRSKLHKTLAWWLLGIAVLVPITGTLVAVNGPRIHPDAMPHGITYRDFVLVMLSEMAVFAALVATAVLNRKRPHIHRSLMMLSGLAILSAATDGRTASWR